MSCGVQTKIPTFNKFENSDIIYDGFSVLTSIRNYIDDCDDDSFGLKSLEKLYTDGLAEIGKSTDSHITWFAPKIVNADIGLTDVQSTSGGKYKTFKTSRFAVGVPEAEWCQMLRNVVQPIMEVIFQVYKIEKSSMSDLSLELLSLQYKKQGFLITYLCNGKPVANYFLLNLDTIYHNVHHRRNQNYPSFQW